MGPGRISRPRDYYLIGETVLHIGTTGPPQSASWLSLIF